MLPTKPWRLTLSLLLGALCGLCGCASTKTREPAPPAVAALTASEPFDPGGIGSLEARTATGDPSVIELTRVQIVGEQRGDMAEVAATHVFRNDSDHTLEGTFRFPMPDGALLTGLAMMIDGKLMEGELIEREKARKVYESIVDSMQDPALLEWEQGSVFKMRVFPIEPRSEKVVVMRYLMPLRRSGDQLELVQATRAAAGEALLARLTIDWRGQRVFDERSVESGRLLAFPAQPTSRILRERREDGTYAAVRVQPNWQRLAQPLPAPAKNWFVLVDTSRSALEEMPRVLEALPLLLGRLPPGARFQLVTSDLDAVASPQGLTAVTPQAITQAVEQLRRIEPDGASDLGRAFTLIGQLSRQTPGSALLYLGDCQPTWGVTKSEQLLALREDQLPHVPIYPLLLGASVDDELASELAAQSGGRRARVRRREELTAFADTLTKGVAVLHDIQIQAPAGTEVLSTGPLSVEQGRDLLLLVKAPPGKDPLHGVAVSARVAGKTVDLLPRAAVEDTKGVRQRFGAAHLRKLERASKPAPEIVAASLDYGVMSKLTSFLVLESEEAYERHAIARRARAGDAPQVTGANLESSDTTEISLDRVQPGDPEIYIDAPRDALKVEVELPFGETKRAVFDLEARGGRGAWMVRFLVPRDTPEGEYDALAHVQYADGRLETKKARYTVDNTPPELSIELLPQARRPGFIEVRVTQPGNSSPSDLRRVELRTPRGRVYQLVAVRWGTFRVYVPEHELTGGSLRVVGFDQALNHSVRELELP